ncbi:MAG: hypothetical protein HRT42_13595, partial [Campylobacteraceae bacterium]|nr:hypothetical protein [Campylobacteraceae bacterium]
KAKKYFKSIKVSKKDDSNIIELSNNIQKNPYSKKDFDDIIKSLNDKYSNSRVFLPCMIEEYEHLRIKNKSSIPWVRSKGLSNYGSIPKMLSPYIKEDDKLVLLINDKLKKWVFDNRYNKDTTLSNIENSYTKFIQDLKEITHVTVISR